MRNTRARLRVWSALGVAGLCLASAGCAGDPRVEASDRVMSQHVEEGVPGCSAAAAVDGNVVWSAARGVAEMEGAVPMTTETRFNIGSVSKQFTALAALMLAEDGLLDLDAPVSAHVDGLPAWSDTVTVRDLMNHTAGILDPQFGGEEPATRERVLDELATDPLTRVDREEFLYSNSGYMLLAMIIEEVTGEPFDSWLAQNVFEPADLDMALQPAGPEDGDAVGYWEEGEPYRPADDGSTLVGPTGIMSSMPGLVRWGREYETHTLVSDSTFEDALAHGTVVGADAIYAAGIIRNGAVLWHNGSDDGMETLFITEPGADTTLAVACNGPQDEEFWVDLPSIWFPSISPAPSDPPGD